MSTLGYSIAHAVQATEAPCIPRAQQWGRDYVSSNPSGEPLLDLSQGVPKAAPHPSILSALAKTSSDPATARYGPILGEPALRAAYAEEIKLQYRGDVTSEDVSITTGCNMAFLVILMALCPPNTSSVLLPLPTYFNNAMSLSLQSVKPIYIPCDPDNSFSASLPAAKTYLAKAKEEDGEVKVRMIVLVTPSNPTGAVYTPEELMEWYNLAKEYGVALVLDETYRDFVEGIPHGLFGLEDWRSTLISIGSFSKGYRIPGHRLGSIIASPELLQHATTICDCMQICAPRSAQIALAPLLPSLRSDLKSACQALAHRRSLFTDTVNAIPGWKVISQGGFYAFVQFPKDYLNASSALGLKRKRLGSEDISKVLALRFGVVTLPGAYFMPATGDDEVWEGIVDGESLREDKWIRFAVANIEDDVVIKLGPRLKQMNHLMGMPEE